MNPALSGIFCVVALCIVNKQVNYIIYAAIMLGCGAGLFVVGKNIPFESTAETNDDGEPVDAVGPVISGNALKGKTFFMGKCAACHVLGKDMTGPNLINIETRGPWADRKKLYEWIKNPSAFMKKDSYTRGLKTQYAAMMTAFPDITNGEIDAIVEYVNVYK